MNDLLDTNICIYSIKKRPQSVLDRFRLLAGGAVEISSITVAELMFGVHKSQHVRKNRQALQRFLLPLEVVPFSSEAAAGYGMIRAKLERDGRPIGPLDLLIAAHAVALKTTLVTNNLREFSRVEGLATENWTGSRVSR